MTADQFRQWLAAMKAAGHIRFDKQAADALGVSQESVRVWKRDGVTGDASQRTALACRALLQGLEPYA